MQTNIAGFAWNGTGGRFAFSTELLQPWRFCSEQLCTAGCSTALPRSDASRIRVFVVDFKFRQAVSPDILAVMSHCELNPYDSPTTASDASNNSNDNSQSHRTQRYRWGTIPAGLSWSVGGALFLCAILWVYQLATGLDEFPRAAIWMLVAIIGSSVLNLWSGRNWMRSRWKSALILNVASFLLLWLTATAVEIYIKSQ